MRPWLWLYHERPRPDLYTIECNLQIDIVVLRIREKRCALVVMSGAKDVQSFILTIHEATFLWWRFLENNVLSILYDPSICSHEPAHTFTRFFALLSHGIAMKLRLKTDYCWFTGLCATIHWLCPLFVIVIVSYRSRIKALLFHQLMFVFFFFRFERLHSQSFSQAVKFSLSGQRV